MHPDVCKAADAEASFRAISEAYRVLSDANLRVIYDEARRNPHRFDKTGGGMGAYGGAAARRAGKSDAPSVHVLHAAFDMITHPLLVAVLMMAGTASIVLSRGEDAHVASLAKESVERDLVEAWYNPRSRRWEQPAPWDGLFDERRVQRVSRRLVHEAAPPICDDDDDEG